MPNTNKFKSSIDAIFYDRYIIYELDVVSITFYRTTWENAFTTYVIFTVIKIVLTDFLYYVLNSNKCHGNVKSQIKDCINYHWWSKFFSRTKTKHTSEFNRIRLNSSCTKAWTFHKLFRVLLQLIEQLYSFVHVSK